MKQYKSNTLTLPEHLHISKLEKAFLLFLFFFFYLFIPLAKDPGDIASSF